MKPFNLTEFKQGKPAVNRAGAIAHFVYHCPELEPLSRLGWRVGSDLYEGCEDGAFRDDCRTTHDLVGMKTGVRVGYVAPEDMEKHFRETVRRTLEEYPPAAPRTTFADCAGSWGRTNARTRYIAPENVSPAALSSMRSAKTPSARGRWRR